jgi:hypothetical protein
MPPTKIVYPLQTYHILDAMNSKKKFKKASSGKKSFRKMPDILSLKYAYFQQYIL